MPRADSGFVFKSGFDQLTICPQPSLVKDFWFFPQSIVGRHFCKYSKRVAAASNCRQSFWAPAVGFRANLGVDWLWTVHEWSTIWGAPARGTPNISPDSTHRALAIVFEKLSYKRGTKVSFLYTFYLFLFLFFRFGSSQTSGLPDRQEGDIYCRRKALPLEFASGSRLFPRNKDEVSFSFKQTLD